MWNFQNLTGQVSGTLIAQQYLGNSRWLCRCLRCGKEKIIATSTFNKNIELKRDGCKHAVEIKIGDTFGYLTVINTAEDYIKPKSQAHERQWLCQCICGREKTILEDNLKALKSTSCGLCKNRISIPEKAITYYLSKTFPDICENYRPSWLKRKEIDIFIPSINVGIEYDGERWHKDPEKDKEKNQIIIDHDIFLIRVREPKCPIIHDSSHIIITPRATTNGTHMTEPIKRIIELLNANFKLDIRTDVDCLRDNADIVKTINSTLGNGSLQVLFPELAKEWDHEKNAPLTPDRVAAHTGTKAWWICPNGHSYSAVVASRTGKTPTGCPICSGKGTLANKDGFYQGIRSLQKIRPDIAIEFDVENNGYTPDRIAVSSHKKVWWKCQKCGFEWQSKVNNRTSSLHTGCPACAKSENKQGVAKIKNSIKKNGSLLDLEPDLCKEWDYSKNDCLPSDITKGSRKKVWWICSKGHSYLAMVNKRTGKNLLDVHIVE